MVYPSNQEMSQPKLGSHQQVRAVFRNQISPLADTVIKPEHHSNLTSSIGKGKSARLDGRILIEPIVNQMGMSTS